MPVKVVELMVGRVVLNSKGPISTLPPAMRAKPSKSVIGKVVSTIPISIRSDTEVSLNSSFT